MAAGPHRRRTAVMPGAYKAARSGGLWEKGLLPGCLLRVEGCGDFSTALEMTRAHRDFSTALEMTRVAATKSYARPGGQGLPMERR